MWRQIDPLTDPGWDDLIARHPRASAFHTRAWLESLRETYRYEPVAYTSSPPGSALENAVLFCRVDSWLTGRRLVSLPFSDHCAPLVSDEQELSAFTSSIGAIAAQERAAYIELRPLQPLARVCEFTPHQTFWFHQIDLRPSLDRLADNLQNDSIRRKICRAEREGLVCKTGHDDSLLDEFWKLFLLTRRRHSAPPPPKQWFRNVLAFFGPAADLRVAYHEHQAVAAVITLRCNDTMIYKYGCSDETCHRLGGMPFLLWTAIRAAKNDGLVAFDLGRSDCDAAGLITFKDRWGAAKSPLTYYRFPAETGRSADARTERRRARLKDALLCRLPDTVFVSAGSLLYRHLG